MSLYVDTIIAEGDAYTREQEIYDAQEILADALINAAESMDMTVEDYKTHANLI